MTKKRSRMADYAVYLVVRIAICVVQALSWQATLNLARFLAWLTYHLDRRHRLVALDNLRHAFGSLDASAQDRLIRDSYLHLVVMVMEMIRLPRILRKHNISDYVNYAEPGDVEQIQAMLKTKRPLIVLTGHFGNWEILSYVMGLAGYRAAVVARKLDNPHLDELVARLRQRTGLMLVDKSADHLQIIDILARGMALGMVGDQDAGSRGLFVNFFGRPASTFKSIGVLALAYQAPIVVMGAARVGQPMQYRVYLEHIIYPEDYAGQSDARRAITQRYTEALERMVRRHPEQYFWLHRRWKSQPPTAKVKAVAA